MARGKHETTYNILERGRLQENEEGNRRGGVVSRNKSEGKYVGYHDGKHRRNKTTYYPSGKRVFSVCNSYRETQARQGR